MTYIVSSGVLNSTHSLSYMGDSKSNVYRFMGILCLVKRAIVIGCLMGDDSHKQIRRLTGQFANKPTYLSQVVDWSNCGLLNSPTATMKNQGDSTNLYSKPNSNSADKLRHARSDAYSAKTGSTK